MTADLHIHTTASDGLFSAEQILNMALNSGLRGIAITDHDTLEGVKTIDLRKVKGLEILTGIEISTQWHDQDIHILGYDFTRNPEVLEKQLHLFQEDRRHRITKIVNKLVALGYDITKEQVEACAKGQSIGRPHIAQAMVNKGYFKDIKSVFDKLIEKGGPAYVPRERTTPQEGIEAILSSGGVPVLAHPGLIKNGYDLIGELVALGIKGIEVYYPLHSRNLITWLLRVAQKYELIATGGSDFHGFEGDFLGKSSVDISVIEAIKSASR